ncbi:LiaI-LiaF-like domain-containing protein [Mucilaginibacter lutimaris]|uniref:LiaI-LiaF-like domain-containing protein n=1 Tax=Mucilaginibacter lutimaris TaxID=931629 RepID=A0ABW2ZBW2_9SPHI
MKSEKLIPGLILVLLGTVFLLDNFHVIDFRWGNILHLWPVFLIMGGVNLVFANNKAPWATALKIGVVILGFALLIFGHFENRWWQRNSHWNFNDKGWYKDNDDDDDDDNGSDSTGIVKVEGSSTYTEPYIATATSAKLNLSGGGTAYSLKDTTDQLFTATTKERFNRYIYTHTMEGNTAVLNLSMKDKKGHIEWDSDNNNKATIKLNVKPEWDININAGATALEFDLSKFKIKSVNIDGGAGSFNIKLGQPLATTNVDVETGVSKVVISVPENAACRITSDSGLSSTDFVGFISKGNNVYETQGFDAAAKKIIIHMKGGLSKFKVTRY